MAAKGDKLPDLRLGIGEAARALKMSRQRVAQLVDDGVLDRDGDGLFAFPQCLWSYIERSREKSAGRAHEGADELRRERIRLARARADSAERQNSVASGKYVLAADVERAWSWQLTTIRSFVMSIPTRAAAVIPSLTRHDCATLDDVVRETLNAAADMLDDGAALSEVGPIADGAEAEIEEVAKCNEK